MLRDYGIDQTICAASADECAARLLAAIEKHFKPVSVFVEYPVQYTNEHGQIVRGMIDLLLETADGFVLIDHKASPRARSEWEEIALSYSGQLALYADGIARATGRQVLSKWIHFGVTGGLVEIRD